MPAAPPVTTATLPARRNDGDAAGRSPGPAAGVGLMRVTLAPRAGTAQSGRQHVQGRARLGHDEYPVDVVGAERPRERGHPIAEQRPLVRSGASPRSTHEAPPPDAGRLEPLSTHANSEAAGHPQQLVEQGLVVHARPG